MRQCAGIYNEAFCRSLAYQDGFNPLIVRMLKSPYRDFSKAIGQIETWFTEMPSMPARQHKHLLGRLTSKKDSDFLGAVWELYAHDLLSRLPIVKSVSYEPQPKKGGNKRRPDFLVVTHTQEHVRCEAHVRNQSDEERKAEIVSEEFRATCQEGLPDVYALSFRFCDIPCSEARARTLGGKAAQQVRDSLPAKGEPLSVYVPNLGSVELRVEDLRTNASEAVVMEKPSLRSAARGIKKGIKDKVNKKSEAIKSGPFILFVGLGYGRDHGYSLCDMLYGSPAVDLLPDGTHTLPCRTGGLFYDVCWKNRQWLSALVESPMMLTPEGWDFCPQAHLNPTAKHQVPPDMLAPCTWECAAGQEDEDEQPDDNALL